MNIRKFTASLHTHVRSLFDAQIDAKALAERIKELGGKGCAITDHGVVSSIEDYRPVFADSGLKLIPGCEVYVDGGILGRKHLILLAANDNGWKGICKVVTESNYNVVNTFPVIGEEKLLELTSLYKGDIIALSACMYGVINAVYLQNSAVQKLIDKALKKQEGYASPSSNDFVDMGHLVSDLKDSVENLIIERDECKRMAESKFVAREKSVSKLEAKGDEGAKEARAELEKDKADAEDAKKRLPEAKKAVEDAKKRLSEAEKELKALNESADKFMEIEAEIDGLKAQLKSDEELDAMAETLAVRYMDAFGEGNFYIEVQYHGIEEEALVFTKVVRLAKKLRLPLVATNDVHILTNSEDDRLRRCILRSLRYGKNTDATFQEENTGDAELYLKDNYELADALLKILPEADVEEAINNIDVIFDRCNVEFKTGKHYPKFSQTEDANDILDKEIEKGIAWRYPEGMDEEHKARLEYETKIIKDMGYADYHLVVKDFLEYGRLLGAVPKEKISEAPLSIAELKEFIETNGWKNPGLRIGPGRGSAVGSLVCYLLGITNLDPIKYGLLFERFLNPERVSMPDIDSDISADTRGKVIEYVQGRYGEGAVCGIMTTNALAPKGALRTASKFYGLKKYGRSLLNEVGASIIKMVPSDVGVSFATTVDAQGNVSDEGTSLYEYLVKKNPSEDAKAILHWALVTEGAFTAYGAHAAGIVISDNSDVSEYIPLRYNTTLKMFTTQCDMVQVEEQGLLKFDFLGLKTLDVITETMFEIEKNTGKVIDPLSIPLDDERVYKEIFSTGRTNSVFQFESNGMKSMLKRFKPTCFEDLIILVSMFRPGPLQYLDDVIEVKNGRKPMTFLCPQLEPILGKTYGAIVYQEQVMAICQELAGFTLGHADNVRRFMSKKKADKLAHERDAFVEGCKNNGIAEDVANTLFDQMMDFASYAFNKSHAAAYAHNAYLTAWFKLYYPSEFFMAALNWATVDAKPQEAVSKLIYDASEVGIKVLTPDINLSRADFTTVDGSIRFGLTAVKGISKAGDVIIKERVKNGAFKDLKDFIVRVHPSAAVIENLISAGAFDAFSDNRSSMKAFVEDIKKPLSDRDKKLSFIESANFALPVIEKLSSDDELIAIQKDNGLKAEVKELTTADKLQKRIDNAEKSLIKFDDEIKAVHLNGVYEDAKERLELEKQALGIYVSSHPMDIYPKAEEVSLLPVSDTSEETTAIYGLVTNLVIKNRKSDGAKMAFFDVEDRSGRINCACFTKAYSRCEKLLKEGSVFKIFGKVNVESDDDDNETLKFIVESISPVKERRGALMMGVSSYAVFHITEEETFKGKYQEEGGYRFLVYDEALGEVRRMNYTVSEDVKLLPLVKEVNL
ncbi:MAG: DNA polymerase III subunit alpha [Butyrivibrio sp.]|uniref:DNA polymerase III subunit alpha n=1 Tax=Butyrivibrio sp. TaxID=28121 RepID=UPI001B4ED546|nr:DNA polymerase III subunit alpha [Butyrivibrio sp.]MBP3278169.1 DNA polymerase III subunit alpha [Butyrivibrio sp.]MBP3782100.1 DNA polymerase III subunit alpha [Butyrivibrio sp.]